MQKYDFTYKWCDGSRHKVDANIAGKVAQELEDQGRLTAQNLVDVSRPEDAPLHKEFEWNDSEAARQYRLTQARGIIRHLTIVTEGSKTPEKMFVNIRIESPEYTTVRKALTIPSEREMLLKNAKRDMEAFIARYQRLKELDSVINAISDALSDFTLFDMGEEQKILKEA